MCEHRYVWCSDVVGEGYEWRLKGSFDGRAVQGFDVVQSLEIAPEHARGDFAPRHHSRRDAYSKLNLMSSATTSRPFTGARLANLDPLRKWKMNVCASGTSQLDAISGCTLRSTSGNTRTVPITEDAVVDEVISGAAADAGVGRIPVMGSDGIPTFSVPPGRGCPAVAEVCDVLPGLARAPQPASATAAAPARPVPRSPRRRSRPVQKVEMYIPQTPSQNSPTSLFRPALQHSPAGAHNTSTSHRPYLLGRRGGMIPIHPANDRRPRPGARGGQRQIVSPGPIGTPLPSRGQEQGSVPRSV